MKPVCLILNNREPIPGTAVERLAGHVDLRWYQEPEEVFSLEAAFAANSDSEILVVTYMDLNGKVLSQLPRLRAIIATTVAFEYIDLEHCKRRNIAVFNTVGYTGTSVAEYAIGQMFAVTRHYAQADRQIRQGDYKCFDCVGMELSQRTAGVVGFGHIGSHVGRCLQGLGMNVLFYARRRQTASFAEYTPLEDLLSRSDVVFLCLPLNRDSAGLIGRPEIALLKHGAVLVSISPEGVLDLDALAARLEAGSIYAALDLHSRQENLMRLPNLLLTPRRAWFTNAAFHRRIESWETMAIEYVNGVALPRLC